MGCANPTGLCGGSSHDSELTSDRSGAGDNERGNDDGEFGCRSGGSSTTSARSPFFHFDPSFLTACSISASHPPHSPVPSLFPLSLYSSPCNNKISRLTGSETRDRSAVATELGVRFIPSPPGVTLVQGLGSSEKPPGCLHRRTYRLITDRSYVWSVSRFCGSRGSNRIQLASAVF